MFIHVCTCRGSRVAVYPTDSCQQFFSTSLVALQLLHHPRWRSLHPKFNYYKFQPGKLIRHRLYYDVTPRMVRRRAPTKKTIYES